MKHERTQQETEEMETGRDLEADEETVMARITAEQIRRCGLAPDAWEAIWDVFQQAIESELEALLLIKRLLRQEAGMTADEITRAALALSKRPYLMQTPIESPTAAPNATPASGSSNTTKEGK